MVNQSIFYESENYHEKSNEIACRWCKYWAIWLERYLTPSSEIWSTLYKFIRIRCVKW